MAFFWLGLRKGMDAGMNHDVGLIRNSEWYKDGPFKIVLFYRYLHILDVEALRDELLLLASGENMLGRVLVSAEGLNGTLAAPADCMSRFIAVMTADSRFSRVDWKYSDAMASVEAPFPCLNIRIVDSIIAPGKGSHGETIINSQIEYDESSFGGIKGGGIHLTATEFHDAIDGVKEGKEGIIIDIRNKFESDIGLFEGAIPVNTNTYPETWKKLDQIIDSSEGGGDKTKPVYMYCTGGIRCEKASAYLKGKGVNNVFQLEGGIHRYIEQYQDTDENLFRGKNFVFDNSHRQAIKEVKSDAEVIGKCLYCSKPHDEYSGLSVCTVCRAMLLCCNECQHNNIHPGEYHCHMHIHLKDCYFTVLERYSVAELIEQKRGLRLIEEHLADNDDRSLKSLRTQRRTLRRQVAKIDARLQYLSEKGNLEYDNPKIENPQVAWWIKQQREQEQLDVQT